MVSVVFVNTSLISPRLLELVPCEIPVTAALDQEKVVPETLLTGI